MPEDDSMFGEMADKINVKLARSLSTTFDGIAKLAMRASAEFSDLESDPGVLQKIEKAHSTVTLIIDDAMRGLSDATMAAMIWAGTARLPSEREDGPPPR
jgi:hypothetical protein